MVFAMLKDLCHTVWSSSSTKDFPQYLEQIWPGPCGRTVCLEGNRCTGTIVVMCFRSIAGLLFCNEVNADTIG